MTQVFLPRGSFACQTANFHDDAGEVKSNWLEALTTAAREGCAFVMLNRTRAAFLDEEDLEKVQGFIWRATRGNKKSPLYARGYKIGESQSKQFKMHRIVMRAEGGVIVDHRNRNTLDNRKSNLRICTSRQNAQNAIGKHMPGRTSMFKGVSFRSYKNYTKPWSAEGSVGKIRARLGYFKTEKEAAIAYNDWARVAFGDFALLNDV